MRKFLWIIYTPFAILSLLLLGWLGYYELFLKDNTLAFNSTFINDASYAEDDTYFMEVQVFDDCVEWKFNYYIDTRVPEQNPDGTVDSKYIMSTGVQLYGNSISYKKDNDGGFFHKYHISGIDLTNCTYYSKPEGLDSGYTSGGATLADQDAWIWDIQGQLCAIKQAPNVKVGKTLWTKNYQEMDVDRLIADNYSSVRSMREGVTITYFDFSRYFRVYMLNEETGKFDKPCEDENILKEWSFMLVKVTVNSNRIISANQSLFGSYKGNPEWTADGGNADGDVFWDENTVKYLRLADMRYVDDKGSLKLALKKSCLDYYDEYSNTEFEVVINLDEINDAINVEGFTADAFGDLKVTKIVLNSSEETTFIVEQDIAVEATNVTVLKGGDA